MGDKAKVPKPGYDTGSSLRTVGKAPPPYEDRVPRDRDHRAEQLDIVLSREMTKAQLIAAMRS